MYTCISFPHDVDTTGGQQLQSAFFPEWGYHSRRSPIQVLTVPMLLHFCTQNRGNRCYIVRPLALEFGLLRIVRQPSADTHVIWVARHKVTRPQTILKFRPPSSLDYRTRHGSQPKLMFFIGELLWTAMQARWLKMGWVSMSQFSTLEDSQLSWWRFLIGVWPIYRSNSYQIFWSDFNIKYDQQNIKCLVGYKAYRNASMRCALQHFNVSQTPEGYISKDIYILSYIRKSPKRIFLILFWSRIFWGYNILFLGISKYHIHILSYILF
jgi:hypothetical protein